MLNKLCDITPADLTVRDEAVEECGRRILENSEYFLE